MKNIIRFVVSLLLIFAFAANALPCGPGYITPIFEYENAPDNPFADFAAGKLGIVEPSMRRIVLIAAYRYLNNRGFSAPEQQALIEVWNAEFDNKPYETDDISETVKKWVEKRKTVVGKDEKTPEIYVERAYGGYDFFPNCTRNAFETATETLSDRITSYGADDKDVKNWLAAQDKVFENCASGKSAPDPVTDAMIEWLKKDRAYQTAAAEFYSLDYDAAKNHFFQISQDYDSPWREASEYLVGRTLIRQASLSKDKSRINLLYIEAEQNLSSVAAKGGKFAASADRLLGLIKYRLRPDERLHELAQIIATQGNEDFRQNVIDYNWLVDKFIKESLEKEEKRKESLKKINEANTNTTVETESSDSNKTESNTNTTVEIPHDEGDLSIYIYSDDYKQNWTFYVKPDATDDEAIAKAETSIGRPLSEKMKEQVRNARREAYKGRFSGSGSEYEGGYYGSEEISLSLLPDVLRQDDLTNWLFAFQVQGNEAYLYALSQYRRTKSDLWLMTALTKAGKSSTELNPLLEAADKIDRNSLVYPTIAYHKARILLEQGKTAEARKMLDDILNSNIELPISSRNKFLIQRAKIAETLDDFLKFSQLKPFGFDWDGTSGRIEDIMAEQKSWYSPETYPEQTKEQYEKSVDEQFKDILPWQNRAMLDTKTVNTINQYFPLSLLIEAEKSPALPDYLRDQFSLTIWTRAILLNDFAAAEKISPEVVKFHSEWQESLDKINTAKTPLAKQRAALYFILKNPIVSPYLEDGMGKTDNEFGNFDANDWWCAPYEMEYDEKSGQEIKSPLPPRPLFLTAAQSNIAQAERKKLTIIGDAPKFLGEKILEWAQFSPTDKRVPESLYLAYEANGWTKFSCGNNEELQKQIGNILKKKYPESEWTQKVLDEGKDQN